MTACAHRGAPQACPLCLLGEGFTARAEQALFILDDRIATALSPELAEGFGYARECVLEREWRLAWLRLRASNIGDEIIQRALS